MMSRWENSPLRRRKSLFRPRSVLFLLCRDFADRNINRHHNTRHHHNLQDTRSRFAFAAAPVQHSFENYGKVSWDFSYSITFWSFKTSKPIDVKSSLRVLAKISKLFGCSGKTCRKRSAKEKSQSS